METSLLPAVSGGRLGMKADLDEISGVLEKTTRMMKTGLGPFVEPPGHSLNADATDNFGTLGAIGKVTRRFRQATSRRSSALLEACEATRIATDPSVIQFQAGQKASAAVSIRNYRAGLVAIAGAEARGVVISTNGIYTKNGTTSLKPLSSPHLATLDWRCEDQGTTVLRAARSPVPFLQSQPKDGTQRGTGGTDAVQPAVGE
ncbi:hypothetical protein SCUP515_08076 [Seiridium cupressi]